MEEKNESNKTLIPLWDGKHETWAHFLAEIKWTVSSLKKDERPLLAARIIRKNLQQGPPSLVQLLYKLEPEDFRAEEDVDRLIKFLEQSPLNKQPLPDAGQKIGQYYRKLHRRQQESVRQFLVREETVHSEMLKALQRLLREKELEFDQYDCTISELKEFVGMKDGASVFFETDSFTERSSEAAGEGEARATGLHGEEASATPKSSSSGVSAPRGRGKDLLQRLMEKGLIPLAALDVIRGWMLLEMCVTNEEDKRLVKAATRNRLSYSEIRQALMSMFEEQGTRSVKGFGRHGIFSMEAEELDTWGSDYIPNYDIASEENYYQQAWEDETWDSGWDDGSWGYVDWTSQEWDSSWPPGEEDAEFQPEVTEELKALIQQKEDAEKDYNELQALMADNQRTLIEARRAVAAASKDRGYGGSVQQKGRPTSTYMQKGKGKSSFSKGKFEANWMKGKDKGKPFYKGKNFNMGKRNFPYRGKGNTHGLNMMGADYQVLSVDEMLGSAEVQNDKEKIAAHESIIDTGATASAGGQEAVSQLCAAITKVRPTAKVTVVQSDKPWFRYGSGRWGRALFRVDLQVHDTMFQVYSLPSPGVPVLVGMRELMRLDAILSCSRSRGVINGRCVHFRKTAKQHLLLDFLQHVFVEDENGKDHSSHFLEIHPGSLHDGATPVGSGELSLFTTACTLTSPSTLTTTCTIPTTRTSTMTCTRYKDEKDTFDTTHTPAVAEFRHEHVEEELLVLDLVFSEQQDQEDLLFFDGSSTRVKVEEEQPWLHLGVSKKDWQFLMDANELDGSSLASQESKPNPKTSSRLHGNFAGSLLQRSVEGYDPGSSSQCPGGTEGCQRDQVQEEEQIGATGSGEVHGSGYEGPSHGQFNLAMHGKAPRMEQCQPLRSLDRMQPLRSSSGVHPKGVSPRTKHSRGPGEQCEGSLTSPPERRMDFSGDHLERSEEHDQRGGQGESFGET